jgi:hypothetical protein
MVNRCAGLIQQGESKFVVIVVISVKQNFLMAIQRQKAESIPLSSVRPTVA